MACDDRRISEWIRSYSPRLLPLARAFAAGPDEAEDILQDVWIRVHERSDSIPADADIGAWLYTITLNEGRSRLRRRRRREALRRLWWRDPIAHTPRGADGIDDELTRAALWRAIAELPALQRDVLLLRIVDDLSTAQVARALERAEGTVKATLFRALRTLRREVAERTISMQDEPEQKKAES